MFSTNYLETERAEGDNTVANYIFTASAFPSEDSLYGLRVT